MTVVQGSDLDIAPVTPGDHDGDVQRFARRSYETGRQAAPALFAALAGLAGRGNKDGHLLVRGLQADDVLPPTGESDRKATRWSEFWLSVAALSLGQPVAYSAIKRGALFQDGFPRPAQRSNLAAGNARADLGLHTELLYHPVQPRWLLLFCLRGDRDGLASTGVASWARVDGQLDDECRDALRRPDFEMRSDLAFRRLGVPETLPRTMAVLHGDPADPFLRYDRDLVTGTTERSIEAFARAGDLLVTATRLHRLVPGDLLVIDNWRAAHSRTSFQPYFDGADRWLQRTYVADPATLTADERSSWLVTRLP